MKSPGMTKKYNKPKTTGEGEDDKWPIPKWKGTGQDIGMSEVGSREESEVTAGMRVRVTRTITKGLLCFLETENEPQPTHRAEALDRLASTGLEVATLGWPVGFFYLFLEPTLFQHCIP
jgi:hypothetical protein